MKKLSIILGLGLTIGLFHVNAVDAQSVSLQVNINLDHQPAWGPVGYDYAAFYYFPALNIYFDVNNAMFYYPDGRKWLASYYLPVAYNRYDLYRMYKVVLNDVPRPWVHNQVHKRNYAHFYNDRSQTPISHAKEYRYSKAKNNTRAWIEPRNDSHRSNSRQLSGNRTDNNQVKSSSDQQKESRNRSSKPEETKKKQSQSQSQEKDRSSSRSGKRSSSSSSSRSGR
ncbi:MAG: hypothetical protein LBT83_08930 [Tannerella sp.]|jgi:hypothetical protein|nr:hypothetical protein [Tannerella sp.]